MDSTFYIVPILTPTCIFTPDHFFHKSKEESFELTKRKSEDV